MRGRGQSALSSATPNATIKQAITREAISKIAAILARTKSIGKEARVLASLSSMGRFRGRTSVFANIAASVFIDAALNNPSCVDEAFRGAKLRLSYPESNGSSAARARAVCQMRPKHGL